MTILTQLRTSRGLTIGELGKGALVSDYELQWIELGGIPRLLDAVRLTQFFNCECDDIFPGTKQHRSTFEGIIAGKIPVKRCRELVMPEFDTDQRFWFFCVRMCGQWRRFYVRSQDLKKIDHVLAVERECFLAVESCGLLIVLNCEHLSAYECVARKDADWVKPDPLDQRDVSVLFADSRREQAFRFQTPSAIGDTLDPVEIATPRAEPFLEFRDGERSLALAAAEVAMMRTSLANL